MIDLSFKEFQGLLRNLRFDNQSSYVQSYPEFIRYFQNVPIIEKHHLVIAGHFTYGWMPTILKLDLSQSEHTLKLLNDVKIGQVLTLKDLEYLKGKINNSLVGVSKLLHFISPQNYAIWDSRIYKAIFNFEPYDYRVGNVKFYTEYLELLSKLARHKEYSQIHQNIEEKVGYKITSLRVIEMVIFENSKLKN